MLGIKRHKVERLDFIVAGAQKSGTTALHYFLKKHPQIALPDRQEMHFFDDEEIFSRPADYELLHRHFRVRAGLALTRRGVLAGELADLVSGEIAEPVVEQELDVGPSGVGVGVVALDHDVVDADAVTKRERRRVVDGAEPEVALQHLARAQVDTTPHRAPPSRVVDDVVEPVEEQRHPSDAALRHRDLELGEAHRHLGPNPVGRTGEGAGREQRGAELERRVG